MLPHQFPLAHANSAIALVLPEHRLTARPAVASERLQQAFALDRRDLVAAELSWVVGAGNVDDRGGDVDDLGRLVNRARLANLCRPARYKRCGDAALVDPVLVATERSDADVRPLDVVAHERVFSAGPYCRVVADPYGPPVAGLQAGENLIRLPPALFVEEFGTAAVV